MMNFDAMISPDNDAAVLNTAHVVETIGAHRLRELVHNSTGRKEIVPDGEPIMLLKLSRNIVESVGFRVFKCFQRAKEANKWLGGGAIEGVVNNCWECLSFAHLDNVIAIQAGEAINLWLSKTVWGKWIYAIP